MPFIHEDFLLESAPAKTLYHDFAKDLPIIDYHCHLSPEDIATDRQFETITQLWLSGDHYKWRAMRTLGVSEKYITGNADDKEKFLQWAASVPYTVRNPLYHWTHLELARYFDCFELLSEKNANEIYTLCNSRLKSPEYSVRNLLKKKNVSVVCTTEDPLEDLKHHKKLVQDKTVPYVSTAFRPDKAILIEQDDFNAYVDTLGALCDTDIQDFESLCDCLLKRITYFHNNGCRLSDHGLTYIPFVLASTKSLQEIFYKRRKKAVLSETEIQKFKTGILLFLSRAYYEHGWVQQFHLGAMRNNNQRMLQLLGPDTGWDSIGSYPIAFSLSKFLNHLDRENHLSKTILYNLNPSDNAMMATLIGNFNDGSIRGKIQWGSGWWFLDQLDGMTEQLNTLSNMGLISCFVGMLTDSRSFLSYPRHEYFRRLLCNLFGADIEKGKLPNDTNWMGRVIADVCYYNAKNYFNFDTETLL